LDIEEDYIFTFTTGYGTTTTKTIVYFVLEVAANSRCNVEISSIHTDEDVLGDFSWSLVSTNAENSDDIEDFLEN